MMNDVSETGIRTSLCYFLSVSGIIACELGMMRLFQTELGINSYLTVIYMVKGCLSIWDVQIISQNWIQLHRFILPKVCV